MSLSAETRALRERMIRPAQLPRNSLSDTQPIAFRKGDDVVVCLDGSAHEVGDPTFCRDAWAVLRRRPRVWAQVAAACPGQHPPTRAPSCPQLGGLRTSRRRRGWSTLIAPRPSMERRRALRVDVWRSLLATSCVATAAPEEGRHSVVDDGYRCSRCGLVVGPSRRSMTRARCRMGVVEDPVPVAARAALVAASQLGAMWRWRLTGRRPLWRRAAGGAGGVAPRVAPALGCEVLCAAPRVVYPLRRAGARGGGFEAVACRWRRCPCFPPVRSMRGASTRRWRVPTPACASGRWLYDGCTLAPPLAD